MQLCLILAQHADMLPQLQEYMCHVGTRLVKSHAQPPTPVPRPSRDVDSQSLACSTKPASTSSAAFSTAPPQSAAV